MALLFDTMMVVGAFGAMLAPTARDTLRARGAAEGVVISTASLWEIAVKKALGKLDMPDDLPARIAVRPIIRLLPVTAAHAWRTLSLPRFKDHKDPFDRLIIAQALEENLTIVTSDAAFARYSVKILTP